MITEDKTRELREQRRQWEDQHYTKLIDCPEHPKQHWAILYENGHEHAGYWECPKGDFEEHDHYEAINDGRADLDIETGETWPTGPLDTPREFRYYVCAGTEGCGIQLEGDPDLDAAEAQADYEADNWDPDR